MDQVIQVAGALMVLAGFVLAQVGWVHHRSYLYLGLNLLGSSLLAVLALLGGQWGFLILEGAWSLVSGWALSRRVWVVARTKDG